MRVALVVGILVVMLSCAPRTNLQDSTPPRVRIVEVIKLNDVFSVSYFKTSLGDECYLVYNGVDCRFSERKE